MTGKDLLELARRISASKSYPPELAGEIPPDVSDHNSTVDYALVLCRMRYYICACG